VPMSPTEAATRRYAVARILQNQRLTPRGRLISCWNYVVGREIEAGTQFLIADPGGQLYTVLGETNEVIQLPRAGRGGDRWHSYFHSVYGFGEREELARFVYDSLRSYVIQHGTKVELRRFSAFNTATKTIYLSGYNGRQWKIDGETIESVPVGEDGVFFADDDNGTTVEPEIGNHGELLERLTSINYAPMGLSGITPHQQQMAFIIWIFALALPDLMPTKPILLLEGTQGSGKSATVQLLQLALMGISQPMILQRNKEDDFGVLLLRSPIAIFDNTDSYIEWVPDAICAYTTAGLWNKRKLYTDDESMVIKPHAFIAIASKNPASFRREDVADRMIIMRLDRRTAFGSFQQLKATMLADRPRLFGEYLFLLNRLVAVLREDGDSLIQDETHRMADFAALARVVGRVFGWDPAEIDGLMLALQGERDAFINEEDPLVDILEKWIAYRVRSTNSCPNVGREITAIQLCTELETIALGNQIPWKHTARTIGQKIRSPHIERVFHVETATVANHRTYKFWRHADLRAVDIGDIPITEED
jgi:hypothetical protein